jgi:GH24 family phage-related lysozyme (muramidase)
MPVTPGFSFDLIKGVEAVKLATPFIHKWEKFKGDAYLDSGGIWTIGWGFTKPGGKPVVKGQKMTKDQADAEFMKIFGKEYVQPVNRAIKREDIEPEMLAALYSLAYNWGTGRVVSSDIMQLINKGEYEKAAALFPTGGRITAGGKKVQGLVNRRNDEMALFLKGAKRAGTKAILASATADVERLSAPTATQSSLTSPLVSAAPAAGQSRISSLLSSSVPLPGVGGIPMAVIAALVGVMALGVVALSLSQRRGPALAPAAA